MEQQEKKYFSIYLQKRNSKFENIVCKGLKTINLILLSSEYPFRVIIDIANESDYKRFIENHKKKLQKLQNQLKKVLIKKELNSFLLCDDHFMASYEESYRKFDEIFKEEE